MKAVLFLIFFLLGGCSFGKPEELKVADPSLRYEFCDKFIDYVVAEKKKANEIRYEKETALFNECSVALKSANDIQKKFISCMKPYKPTDMLEMNKQYFLQSCFELRGKW